MELETEQEAILSAKEGSPDGHAYLYKRYRVFVISSIAKLISEPDIAEDLCQDTFIKVIEKIHQFKGDSKFSTWLYRIAVNMALGHIRKNKSKKPVSLEDLSEQQVERTLKDVSDEKLLDERFIESDYVKQIFAIKEISEEDRMLFFQHYIVGRTHLELSDIHGISISSMKSKIYRTRESVREYFKKKEGKLNDAPA